MSHISQMERLCNMSLLLTGKVLTMDGIMKLQLGKTHRKYHTRRVGLEFVMIYSQDDNLAKRMSKTLLEL